MLKKLTSTSAYVLYFIITTAFLVLLLAANIYKNNTTHKSNIEYLTYEDLSTSVDEHNRLHLLLYKEGKTLILSDTVALGIHAQISNIVYKDYIQKTK